LPYAAGKEPLLMILSRHRWLVSSAFVCVFPLLAACSEYTLGEPETPPVHLFAAPARTDVATVCVIRPSHMLLGVTFVVRDDDQLVGATRGESWFCYEADPGEHRIVSSTEDPIDSYGEAHLTAEAGRRYWLYQNYDNFFGAVTSRLEWVAESRAHELMDGVTADYKVIVGVPGNQKLPATIPRAPAMAAR
jgi:hypothetical protein